MAAITTPTLIQPNEVVNGGVLKATPLNARFDVTLIAPHIDIAEIRHLVPSIICQEFYDDLMSKKNGIVSNYNTAIGAVVQAFPNDAKYELLWAKYLLPFLSWAVYYEAQPFITLQTGSNGTYIHNTEYANNAGVSGSKYLQDTVLENRIVPLGKRMSDFLCQNKADYPLFCDDNCPESCGCGDTENETDVEKRWGLFYVTGSRNLF